MRIEDAFNLKIGCNFGVTRDNDVTGFDFSQLGSDATAWGVSKFVIFPSGSLDKVIKIPFDGTWEYNYAEDDDEWFPFEVVTDYCEKEADIYQEAVDAGIECFFAETKFGGCTKDGTKFYISERVKTYDFSREASDGSKRKATDIYSPLGDFWIANAIDFYGLDKVNELVKFLHDHNLYDFHDDNIGMREDGAPVLLDYSDYDG